MSRLEVQSITHGRKVDEGYMVLSRHDRLSRSGRPYHVFTLGDRTGSIPAIVWSDGAAFSAGDIVHVVGRAQAGRGGPEICVDEIWPCDPWSCSLADLTPGAPCEPAVYLSRLSELVDTIEHDGYRELIHAFLADPEWGIAFQSAPASINHHHAYESGLLQHTVDLMDAAIRYARGREDPLDLDLLLTAAFFHDAGKADSYTRTYPYRLSEAGRLVGHELLGLRVLWSLFERVPGLAEPDRLRLLNALAPPDSAHAPRSREGIALAALDGLDARLNLAGDSLARGPEIFAYAGGAAR
jgi:3'-5' exoribonuclease